MSLLKRWKTSIFQSEEATPEEELDIEDKEANEVEKVLRWKKTGRNQPPAYSVLWKGSPLEEATWESASRFNPENFRQWIARDNPPEEISEERGRS